jgi:penicillin amidase
VDFLPLDAASNWTQFQQASSSLPISLNFVYADVQGNIGYQMSGLLPIRATENRTLPVNGADARYDWSGYVARQRLPTLFNPASHMIVVANNQIIPDSDGLYVTNYWDEGYRARRISDLLGQQGALSSADFARIQADVYSIPAATLTDYLLAAGRNSRDAYVMTAVKLLQGWNATVTSGSVAASIYEISSNFLLRQIGEKLLGKELYNSYQDNTDITTQITFLIASIQHPQAALFGSASSNVAANRDSVIQSALKAAVHQLRTQYGNDQQQWQWGHLHQAKFSSPLADVGPLSLIFSIPALERPGDDTTVDIGGDDNATADPPGYDQMTVSSMREIIDLAHIDTSLWVITTGESGQPFSSHYDDLSVLWNQNTYQRMLFSRISRERLSYDYLRLLPG